MKHIPVLGKAIVVVTLVFVAANHVTFPLLKAAVSESKFRAVVAASASQYLAGRERVSLFIGNSRIMGGIDPVTISREGRTAYNLAYNGLYLEDLRLLLDAFIRSCGCVVDTLYANPDIFRTAQSPVDGISELQRFFSGFDPAALQAVQQKDAVYAAAMRLFPLLHFNNEFFLRALYYRVTGNDDQNYSSDYKFTFSPVMERRLQALSLDARLDVAALQDLESRLASSGIRLVVIEPPYHRVYLENVPGFEQVQAQTRTVITEAGIEYLDHSDLFYDRPGLFSDPLHLNRAGQRHYSEYLLDTMQMHDGDTAATD